MLVPAGVPAACDANGAPTTARPATDHQRILDIEPHGDTWSHPHAGRALLVDKSAAQSFLILALHSLVGVSFRGPMFVKSQCGIVRAVAVRRAAAQVSGEVVDTIALLTLFCKTGRRTTVDAVRSRFAGMCAMRTQPRVNCARTACQRLLCSNPELP